MSVIKVFVAGLVILSLAVPVGAQVDTGVGDDSLQPISGDAYVDDLVDLGFRNGAMPDTRMIDVGNCRLERDAAYTLSLLLDDARNDGVELVAHDCYRNFDVQAAAYERRCPMVEEEVVEIDPETGEEVVVAVERSRACSGPPIARAGRSNHGWGRAVDFGIGGRVLSCGDAALVWLQQNAGRFGWVHPGWAECGESTREPWHWEWGGLEEVLSLALPADRRVKSSGVRLR